MKPGKGPATSLAYAYDPPTFGRIVAQYAKHRAMTIATIAPTNQIRIETGPMRAAIRDGITKMSAPIAEPMTRLVVSKVLSCLRREIFRADDIFALLAGGA